MSEMEAHKGKLVPMTLNGVTMEERAEDACKQLGLEWDDDYHNSWLDCLNDQGYRKAFVGGDIIYKVEDVVLDPFGFTEAFKNDDGTIDYVVLWYNGGAGFDEVIASAIENTEG